MQMKFAHLLVTNEGRMNGYECAKEAGYSEDRARVTASELQSPKKYPPILEGKSSEELKEKVKTKQKQLRLKNVSSTSSSLQPKKSESSSDPQK